MVVGGSVSRMIRTPIVGDLVRLTWDRAHLKLFFLDDCPSFVNRKPMQAGVIDHDTTYLVVRVSHDIMGTFLGLITPDYSLCWTTSDWMEVV